LLFLSIGAFLVWSNDIRHDDKWFGTNYTPGAILQVRLNEPLVEKTNSYKAVATIQLVHSNKTWENTKGEVIIYFKKDTALNKLNYGSILIVSKNLQEIKNSGNPGSFDYKRYNLFQGITHQLYLTQQDFILLPGKDKSFIKELIFQSRSFIISILRQYISGDKEQGLAEALLIGYKDDLDKNLVQSYTNTGVVHVIAISGLHLGIIYWLLLLLTKPLKSKKTALLRLVLIIAGLWSFSLLAGAQPSVLRSAVMFTAIACSTVISRRTSIYNTLALSAFLLLWYNPFWLWDVGFQLSYSAVLSIIIFFRPIYNWIYFPNKAIDFIWKLMAASLAAQILTLPISIYHFHQFPFLFLIANLFAVPLSSIILIGEIILCLFHFITPFATFIGYLLQKLIVLMNEAVLNLDQLSFAVWNGLSISVWQAIFLYCIIGLLSFWLLEKSGKALPIAIGFCFLFFLLRTVSFLNANDQKKVIVYNVPKYPAIDFIDGRNYFFAGDTTLEHNAFLRNFHIQPSRILHRINKKELLREKSFAFNGKTFLIVDTTLHLNPSPSKPQIDLLVLSKNPKIYITNLQKAFSIQQIVFDGSVPQWKAKLWKRDCDSLNIPYYDVSEKGAFVMKL
jgi:competence protein ComEC